MKTDERISELEELRGRLTDEAACHRKLRDRYRKEASRMKNEVDFNRERVEKYREWLGNGKENETKLHNAFEEYKRKRDSIKDKIYELRAQGITDVDGLKREWNDCHLKVLQYYTQIDRFNDSTNDLNDRIKECTELADEAERKLKLLKASAKKESEELTRCEKELKEIEKEMK